MYTLCAVYVKASITWVISLSNHKKGYLWLILYFKQHLLSILLLPHYSYLFLLFVINNFLGSFFEKTNWLGGTLEYAKCRTINHVVELYYKGDCFNQTYKIYCFYLLTLWGRSLLYRNQFTDLQSISIDWFLYDMLIVKSKKWIAWLGFSMYNCYSRRRFRILPRIYDGAVFQKQVKAKIFSILLGSLKAYVL